MNTIVGQWGVWLEWLAANAVGALAGGLAVTLLSLAVAEEESVYAGILILPALLATSQWLFLRRLFGVSVSWIPTNVLLSAAMLVPLFGLAWLAVDNAKGSITESQLLALAAICTFVAIGFGGVQRMILYQWYRARLRWISATAIGAAPGLTAALYLSAILPERIGIGAPATLNMLWVFLWIVIAVPQGFVLDRVARRGASEDGVAIDA